MMSSPMLWYMAGGLLLKRNNQKGSGLVDTRYRWKKDYLTENEWRGD